MLDQLINDLSINQSDVFANELLFDDTGAYTGFDASQPTSRSGGKANAIRLIKQRDSINQIVMIGDGVTDLETMFPVKAINVNTINVNTDAINVNTDAINVNTDVINVNAINVDMQPAASAFIGYGGVTVRERVKRDANWFVHDWKQIIDVFNNMKS